MRFAKRLRHSFLWKLEKCPVEDKVLTARSGGRGRRWGPELRAPQQWREDAEQGQPGGRACAERAAREDDEVRRGRSFGRRQQWREDAEQWREDPEAAGAAGRPGCAELAVTS
jgi:hypothetical protein